MEIKIPFNKWSKERLVYTKCATSRTKKYGEVGDWFKVDNVKYELDLVIKLPFWFIFQELWRSEGAVCDFELGMVWKEIHPVKGIDENQLVWYHHFKPKDL